MTDLDHRLAAHFARLGPTKAFDAGLRVRLQAERERMARFDRDTALRAAMAERAWQRDREYRRQRVAVWSLVALGCLGVALVAFTSAWWAGLADGIGAGVTAGAQGFAGANGYGVEQVVLAVVAAIVLVAALRPRWLRAGRDALLG
jgi:predicted anti-sigma-YlaC factor YlaD